MEEVTRTEPQSWKIEWKKYAWEFLSIFVAVTTAFALNNWSDNRRDARAESKILLEIKNGLSKDIGDLKLNMHGHEAGIESCKFFRQMVNGEIVSQDSLMMKYVRLTRDFTSLQNRSGYETLKSRGLELMKNDSLRSELIALYEHDYYTLRKLEEGYEETQFQKNYFKDINNILAEHFNYDEKGNVTSINLPLKISSKEKSLMLSYLLKIQINRNFVLAYYKKVVNKVESLEKQL